MSKLYQYKAEHYGKAVSVSDVSAGPTIVNHLDSYVSTCLGNGHEPWSRSAKYAGRYNGLKKYVLLEIDRRTIKLDKYPSVRAEYILMQTTDPWASGGILSARPIQVWVRPDWITPLTSEKKTKAELLATLREQWNK